MGFLYDGYGWSSLVEMVLLALVAAIAIAVVADVIAAIIGVWSVGCGLRTGRRIAGIASFVGFVVTVVAGFTVASYAEHSGYSDHWALLAYPAGCAVSFRVARCIGRATVA
jgi:hypothetical protein